MHPNILVHGAWADNNNDLGGVAISFPHAAEMNPNHMMKKKMPWNNTTSHIIPTLQRIQ
jgi:hypothetical protein